MASNSIVLSATLPTKTTKLLDPQGYPNLSWYLFWRALGNNNSTIDLTILESEIATATATANEALSEVSTAKTDAAAALTLAESLEFVTPLIYANDENIAQPVFATNFEETSVTIVNNLTIYEDTINTHNNNSLIFAALDQGSLIR